MCDICKVVRDYINNATEPHDSVSTEQIKLISDTFMGAIHDEYGLVNDCTPAVLGFVLLLYSQNEALKYKLDQMIKEMISLRRDIHAVEEEVMYMPEHSGYQRASEEFEELSSRKAKRRRTSKE